MDIICAGCGEHFSNAEAVKAHEVHCKKILNLNPIPLIPMKQVITKIQESSTTTHLDICPSCKKKSLMFNQVSIIYECVNTECGSTFFKASIDKFNQQMETDKKTIDSLAGKETRSWFGNQYYDPKAKKWRDGKQSKRVNLGRNSWLWILALLIIIGIIVTLFFTLQR